jgi:hypothetical protein
MASDTVAVAPVGQSKPMWFRRINVRCPFAMIPIQAIQDSRLTHGEFHMLCALIGFANPNGRVNVGFSLEQMAKTIGSTRHSAQDYLRKLVEAGWVEKALRGGKPSLLTLKIPDDIGEHLNKVPPKRPASPAKLAFLGKADVLPGSEIEVPALAPEGRTQEQWDAMSPKGRIRFMEIKRRSE